MNSYTERPQEVSNKALHPRLVSALLMILFGVGFILTPYWTILPSFSSRTAALVLIILTGWLWSRWASGALPLKGIPHGTGLLPVIFTVLLLINTKSLAAPIPWQGDEDFHIKVLQLLHYNLHSIWPALLPLTAYLAAVRKEHRLANLLGACTLLTFISFACISTLSPVAMLRYPFISRYAQAIPLVIMSPFKTISPEMPFRWLPFLSTVCLAWVVARSLRGRGATLQLAAGFSAGTIPLVFYYSSILYLEMPAVLLMTVASLDIFRLLRDDITSLKQRWSWYALILLGFIKETTFPFLAAFVVCRSILALVSGKDNLRRKWTDELKITFCTMAPLLLYIFFRSIAGISRDFSPTPQNLILPQAWSLFGLSLAEQFGVFLLLVMCGAAVMARTRKNLCLIFCCTAFFFTAAFHITDNLQYVGYSRFNLFLVPLFLSAYISLLYSIKSKVLCASLILLVILGNIHLSPINRDGTRKPGWGNGLVDTSEHHYPYRESIAWLSRNYRSSRILFSKPYYPYYLDFYFQHFRWIPNHIILRRPNSRKSDQEYLKELLLAAGSGTDIVVFHSISHTPRLPEENGTFCLVKTFKNQAHSLYVYRKTDQ